MGLQKTIMIYRVTCTRADDINDLGYEWDLNPWGENVEYYQGYDDGGTVYVLPPGVTLEDSGELQLYDEHDHLVQIVGDDNPVLVFADGKRVALEPAPSGERGL